jgi:hypothetical protein
MNRSFRRMAIVSLTSIMLLIGADLSLAAGGSKGGRSGSQCLGSGSGQQTGGGNQHRYGQGGKSSTVDRSGGQRLGDGSKPQPGDGTGFGAKAKDATSSN